MFDIKIQMAIATAAAILSGLLLLGIGYIIAPYTLSSGEVPMPVPSFTHQIFTGLLWVGLTAFIAFAVVALVVIISQARQKKLQVALEEQA